MAEFLRKRKDKQRRVPSARPAAGPSLAKAEPPSTLPPAVAPSPAADPANVVEIKLFSAAPDDVTRFNLMKFNHPKDFDPLAIQHPRLTRKQPGEKTVPLIALDDEGHILGRYVYDNNGELLFGADGRPVIEENEGMDMSLVGQAPGQAKRRQKNMVREVGDQDLEVIRLRREEALPWVLEAKDQSIIKNGSSSGSVSQGAPPEQWIGRMVESSTLPMVLFVNEGKGEGFEVVPLSRTYKFNPERPFKVLDADMANKMFEFQAKNKYVDRWAQRPDGPFAIPTANVKAERDDRAAQFEKRVLQRNGSGGINIPRVKQERYEDDYLREGRSAQRGMEGGIDEDLDFDENEHFQDDDDNNEFHRNEEEEEEAKLQEERLKKEFRMANANVGDRPQIGSDKEEDDLFGDREHELTKDGKKMRKLMRKRAADGEEDLWGSSESDDDDSETASVKTNKTEKKEEAEKEKERERSAPPSAEKDRSRAGSRQPPNGRSTASPSRGYTPSASQPGSGSALLAQRATAQDSPRKARGQSPGGRSRTSPEGRSVSPTPRAGSPSLGRSGSPGAAAGSTSPPVRPTQKNRNTTSESQSPLRDGTSNSTPASSSSTPTPGASGAGASGSNKRKNSPAPSSSMSGPSDNRLNKKKKRSSATPTPTPGPPDIAPFDGMITARDVVDWFRQKGKVTNGAEMQELVNAFKPRIVAVPDKKDDQQKLFLAAVKEVSERAGTKMVVRQQYR